MVGPVNPVDPTYATVAAAGQHFAANLWPGRPAAIRPVFIGYYRAMSELAQVLMRLFALGLGLEESFFFDAKIEPHQPAAPAQLPGPVRAAAAGPAPRGSAFGLWQPDDPRHRGQARRPAGAQRRRRVGGRTGRPRLFHRQPRRSDGTLDQRRLGLDIAPGPQPLGVNIVSGWHKIEYSQMGLWPGDDHFGKRYDYSSEYVRVMQELWE